MKSTVFVTIPIIAGAALLLAAGLALLIYFLVYKRRINRAVRGEGEAHAMPAPRGVAATVAAVVCAACLVALFVLVFGIRRDLAALSARLTASVSELDQRVLPLEEAGGVFETLDMHCAELDLKAHRMTVEFSAVPRVAPDDGVVRILFGGAEAELRKNGELYFGSASFDPVFGLAYEARAQYTANGAQVTRPLLFSMHSCLDGLVPQVRFELGDGSSAYEPEDGKTAVKLDGEVFYGLYRGRVEAAALEIGAGGSVFETRDVTSLFRESEGGYSAHLHVDGVYDTHGEELSVVLQLMASDGLVYRAELAACTPGRLVTLASRFASAYTPEGEMLLP
ncbi:MAG: hypothetical protein II124_04500 [Clostridia bacterium]|nr:hypothetical protein [Clostridia bacterium]MBQ4342195.1 hypothetical protein [Clostridia bacterium]